jgi:hypothetical protein
MTDHIHWAGPVDTTVNAFGQDLTITVDEVPGDPIGTLRIKEASFVGTGLVLPNSTKGSPTTNPIPGTNPVLVVRQDGSWPSDYIQVEPASGPIDPFNQDAAWITTGTLPYQRLAGTIPENDTIVLWNRPTLVTPGTAKDSWRWLYNGTRTVYGNEFNLLRVRGVPEDQVPARFMSNAARDGLSTAIAQATLSDAATHMFQVLGNGDILSAGGRSMLPSAPLGVAFNGTIANATLINDGNPLNTGAPYPVTSTYVPSDNRVWMDGNFTNTGASVPAQTTLFTIDAAHRPAAWVQFVGRTSGNLAVRFTCKGATGVCVADQAIGTGITYSLDGANFRKA